MGHYHVVIHRYETLKHPLAATLKEHVEFGMRHAEAEWMSERDMLTIISKNLV